MQEFRNYLKERLQGNAGGGFLISRSQMPQIEDVDDFFSYIGQYGHAVFDAYGTVEHYTPTQHEFNAEKVQAIMSDWQQGHHIIVSSDGYVLDGHHRYFAALFLGEELTIYEVDVKINKLLALAIEYTETV